MFHIRVQSTSQKVELSEKIRVLLSELPLTYKERHTLVNYRNSFLPFSMRVLPHSLHLTIAIGGFLLVSYLLKQIEKRRHMSNSC